MQSAWWHWWNGGMQSAWWHWWHGGMQSAWWKHTAKTPDHAPLYRFRKASVYAISMVETHLGGNRGRSPPHAHRHARRVHQPRNSEYTQDHRSCSMGMDYASNNQAMEQQYC
jgi:hypothetical protein